MPVSGISVGQDCRLVVISPLGARIDLKKITGFDARQTIKTVHSDPLNGPPIEAHLPGGWTGTFNLDRSDSTQDDLFSQIEQNYWNGQTLGFGQVFQYVTEANGSTSTYQFNNVTMSLAQAGNYAQNTTVKQTINFFASTRPKL